MFSSSSSLPTTFKPVIRPLPRSLYPTKIVFDNKDFQREDESDDGGFYKTPRFVQHIDDAAIQRLKWYFGGFVGQHGSAAATEGEPNKQVIEIWECVISPGDKVVDLCSSWTSHFPEHLNPRKEDSNGEDLSPSSSRIASCIGYGLNASEMKANPSLTSYYVRDLNKPPTTVLKSAPSASALTQTHLHEVASSSIDKVICNVSVDYLTSPIVIVSEARRVLKPGGWCHLTFSNRCFPSKVVGKWLKMSDSDRRRWVGGYFWAEGENTSEEGISSMGNGWENVEEVVLNEGGYEDPLYVVRARKSRP